MVRKNFPVDIRSFFQETDHLQKLEAAHDEEYMKKFYSCLYFLLKEIYYYGFLQDKNAAWKFRNAVWALKSEDQYKNDFKKKKAIGDFTEYLKLIPNNTSFGPLCQAVMTEYMLQNHGDKMVHVTERSKEDDPEIFKHYRAILYEGIRKAFIEYLKQDPYLVLCDPSDRSELCKDSKEEDYTSKWDIGCFRKVKNTLKTDPLLYSWFISVHFLHPRQLNHLSGSIRNYLQFINSIETRATSNHSRTTDISKTVKYYESILEVLSVAQLYVGRISQCREDYFSDETYAGFLSELVDFELEGQKKIDALKTFCDTEVTGNSKTDRIGIYYDPEKLILNRNVVYAFMYGNPHILAKSMNPITMEEIMDYYHDAEKLKPVFERGRCLSEKEQTDLRQYQNKKNRIELLDLMTYTEAVNDLMGHLVSWAYIRERDLMYFQLGYYYTSLFFTDSFSAESPFRALNGHLAKIKGKNVRILDDNFAICDGAILYQIVALYQYELNVIRYDHESGEAFLPNRNGSMAGLSKSEFVNHYCDGDESVLNAGMEFFERANEEIDIRKTRNYIDHFEHFVTPTRSILNLYCEFYDRFFDYDLKLKKSMFFVLKNALMRYQINLHTSMKTGTRTVTYTVETGEKAEERTKERHASKLVIGKKGLESEKYTYKFQDKNEKQHKCQVPVHDELFLEQMRRILEYHIE